MPWQRLPPVLAAAREASGFFRRSGAGGGISLRRQAQTRLESGHLEGGFTAQAWSACRADRVGLQVGVRSGGPLSWSFFFSYKTSKHTRSVEKKRQAYTPSRSKLYVTLILIFWYTKFIFKL